MEEFAEIVLMDVDFLLDHKDPDNPRTISDGAFARLVGSIAEHGVLRPAVFNKRFQLLVASHQSIEAAQSLGMTHYPVMIVDMDELQHKAAQLALNAEYGVYDDAKTSAILSHLKEKKYDLDFTGLEPWRIEKLRDWKPDIEIKAKDRPLSEDPPQMQQQAKLVICPMCSHAFDPKNYKMKRETYDSFE